MTRRTGSAALSDVKYVEVVQRGRSLKALAIGIALLIIGALLAWLSSFDVVGASIGKLTASAGLDTGSTDIQGILDSTLGGFTGMINQSLRLGAIGMLLLGPIALMYYFVSGETAIGTNLGGEQVKITIARSQARRAHAFINVFFKCKAAATAT